MLYIRDVGEVGRGEKARKQDLQAGQYVRRRISDPEHTVWKDGGKFEGLVANR